MPAVLRASDDRIVIDSPPLAAVSDVLNLLPLADGVLYVIKFNTVKRKTAVMNVRRLWESNTPVFGAILNNITSLGEPPSLQTRPLPAQGAALTTSSSIDGWCMRSRQYR